MQLRECSVLQLYDELHRLFPLWCGSPESLSVVSLCNNPDVTLKAQMENLCREQEGRDRVTKTAIDSVVKSVNAMMES